MSMQTEFNEAYNYFAQLQQKICQQLEQLGLEEKFISDSWQHNSVIGKTNILENGELFEKAGVGLSKLSGQKLPPSASLKRPELVNRNFQVCGISLVIHPRNPYVPTTHANLRLFIAPPNSSDERTIWWFGGGFDLTPYYPFKEDCIHWHKMALAACEPFGDTVYPEYKKCCDEYFYLKHRQEARGIGGLFFDDVNHWDFNTCFAFIKSVGEHFSKAYLPIVERRMHTPYDQQQRDFQLYRRGRYVEFNLLQDRGTLFGIQTGGRTESILLSMPPKVAWRYCANFADNSPEAKLQKFIEPRNWLEEAEIIM